MSKGPAFSIEGILALTVLLIFFIPVFVVSCVCRARRIEPPHPYATATWFVVGSTIVTSVLVVYFS